MVTSNAPRRDALYVKVLLGIAFAALAAAAPLAAQVLADSSPLIEPVPSAPAYIPMSLHERWHGYLHENLLGSKFVIGVFASAFISHISRDPVEWGVGANGYVHRVENRFFTAGIDGVVHSSLAAALHQDTRYHRGDGTALQRAGHAMGRTFFTYNEAGHRVFDFSGMAGIYGSSMLSTYWHPRPSPMGAGVRAGNFGVIVQAGTNLFKEFEPDVKRLLSRK